MLYGSSSSGLFRLKIGLWQVLPFQLSIMIPLLAHYVQIEFADIVLLISIICANKYTSLLDVYALT